VCVCSLNKHLHNNITFDKSVATCSDKPEASHYISNSTFNNNNCLTAHCPRLPACSRKIKPSGFYWSKRQWVAVASAFNTHSNEAPGRLGLGGPWDSGQKVDFLGCRHISTSGLASTATETAIFALFCQYSPAICTRWYKWIFQQQGGSACFCQIRVSFTTGQHGWPS